MSKHLILSCVQRRGLYAPDTSQILAESVRIVSITEVLDHCCRSSSIRENTALCLSLSKDNCLLRVVVRGALNLYFYLTGCQRDTQETCGEGKIV